MGLTVLVLKSELENPQTVNELKNISEGYSEEGEYVKIVPVRGRLVEVLKVLLRSGTNYELKNDYSETDSKSA